MIDQFTQVVNGLESYMKLFAGRTDAWGTGAGGVVRADLTSRQYGAHLVGQGPGLGIFPLLDDGTCLFGAVDLDEPDIEAAYQIRDFLPSSTGCPVELTRSGNYHVWCFFHRPLPAWAARTVLRSACEAAGKPRTEVFPKQDRVPPGGVGNYINLPYFGQTRPILTRLENGAVTRLPLEDFLREAFLQDADQWEALAIQLGGKPPEERAQTSEFRSSQTLHCCAEHILEHMHDQPLAPGHRAVVLFNLSKMLLNFEPLDEDDARQLVHDVNDAGLEPAPAREVDRQFDNALRGQWTSTGCDDPLFQPYAHPDCPIAHG